MALAVGLADLASAHEVLVHENITLHGANSAVESSESYNEFLNAIRIPGGILLFDFGEHLRSPAGWLREGAAREDDSGKDAGGLRSYNHFYDPLSGEGLSCFPPDRKFPPFGRDSFTWASGVISSGLDFRPDLQKAKNVGTANDWQWQSARAFEWIGLTHADPNVREANLAQMFRALGDVVHLLQDTTQPQHVRNEQHLDERFLGVWAPWKSPIETYMGIVFLLGAGEMSVSGDQPKFTGPQKT